MLRSRLLTAITLLMFCVICPETRGGQAETNPVTADKIILLENKTAKLVLKLEVRDSENEIVINLEHLSDPKAVENSMRLKDQSGEEQNLNPNYDKKKLKLKFKTEGIFYFEYTDPAITISDLKYTLDIKQDKNTHTATGNRSGSFWITNGTKFTWPENIKVKFSNKKEQVVEIGTIKEERNSDKKSRVCFGPDQIPEEFLKYSVSITDFETGKASPSLVMDMKQAWAQQPYYYQLPGTIALKIDCKLTNTVEEKDFKTTVINPAFPLVKRNDLQITQTLVDFPFIQMTKPGKTDFLLRGNFNEDYLYEYTARSGPDLAFLVPFKKTINERTLKANDSVRYTHRTPLPDRKLLVNTEESLGLLKSQLDGIHNNLIQWITLAKISAENYQLIESISKETKLLDELNYFKNLIDTNSRSKLLNLEDSSRLKNLIVVTQEAIESESKKLSQIRLKSYFNDLEQSEIIYLPSNSIDYKQSFKLAIAGNAPILKQLEIIDDNVETIASFFEKISPDEEYSNNLRSLAALGEYDAQVTLLRQQRAEQTKMAKCLIQTYNALVSKSANMDSIKIEVIQVRLRSNPRFQNVNVTDLKPLLLEY